MSANAPGNPASELVRALALAWKNLAAYPAGHPALAGSLEQAQRRLDALRGPAGDVTFGIASDGLLYGNEKLTDIHAHKLAYVLYANRVAVIRFDFGVDANELATFLRVLGIRAHRGAVWDELTAAGVAHIHLEAVDYSGVQMTDTLDEPPPERASLWDEIVRALLAGKEIGGARAERYAGSVDELSALIVKTLEEANADVEFDPNATFGLKRVPDSPEQIMARVGGAVRLYLAGSSGTRRQLAVQQVAHLLSTLAEPMRAVVLRAALQALTVDPNATSHLRDLTATIPRDYLLEALRKLDANAFAGHALDFFRSLGGDGVTRPQATNAPIEIDRELVTLFGDDDVDRFNPPDHQALLDDVSLNMPHFAAATKSIADLGVLADTVAEDEVTRQVADTALELAGKFGDKRDPATLLQRIETAFHQQIASGRFAEALQVIERLRAFAARPQSPLSEGAAQSLARLAAPSIINDLLASVAKAPERAPEMHRVIQALGLAASRAVLVALSEEENRSRRRRLFDFAATLGPALIDDIPEFLRDNRWYVVRNMIMLLRSIGDRSLLTEIRRCAHHPDLRVRLEAIKTLLAFDTSVPRTLLERAIHDPDPKLAETAIALIGSYGIHEGADPLLQILEKRDVFGAQTALRIRAIKSLGELARPEALPRMEHLFKETLLPWPPIAERRAAYESLAAYPPDARRPFVERGLKSRDPIVRDICRRLAVKS